jgi:ribosomal protein L21
MKYAVIRINKNQHQAKEGEEILVDYIKTDKPEAEVLMVVDNGNLHLGKPELSKAEVLLKVLEPSVKGKKQSVATFKAKSRYRRSRGTRPHHTLIKVEKITV